VERWRVGGLLCHISFRPPHFLSDQTTMASRTFPLSYYFQYFSNIVSISITDSPLQGKRAEVGTPKYLANAMKAKGLQRLRWYCQVCEKQCRDENGFKCHTQSEGHLRQMLVVGESAGKHISDYSTQFQNEFVTLLSRT
jgi:hypothetical protein